MRYTGSRDGKETRRDVKGWEWEIDPKTGEPKLAKDSAAVMREQAAELTRETKGALRGTRATDKSRSMGNPAMYAKGGSVRGGGCEQRGKTRGKFV
jgi:hypothetical protein